MTTPDAPSISHYVNDAGAYVLCISAVPDEHLHRPLIVHLGDDTVLDESTRDGREELGWCAWCEEAQSPTYLRHEGHDPECPLAPPSGANRTRAGRG
jgi:hypothetical protein